MLFCSHDDNNNDYSNDYIYNDIIQNDKNPVLTMSVACVKCSMYVISFNTCNNPTEYFYPICTCRPESS